MKRSANKPTGNIDQLALVAVSGSQAGDLMQQLTKNGFYFTKKEGNREVATSGTFEATRRDV